jgi:hypothetical protein
MSVAAKKVSSPVARQMSAPRSRWPLRVGESSQAITVNADAPLVGTTTSDVSGLVAAQQIRDLPLNGRSYDELMT